MNAETIRHRHLERYGHLNVVETDRGVFCNDCNKMLKPLEEYDSNKIYDVAIATSTYFGEYGNVPNRDYRMDLFLRLAQSLRISHLGAWRVLWLIHDDASPVFPEMPKLPFDVMVLRRSKNIGQPQNYLSTVQHAAAEANWVAVIDDDGEVKPDWLKRAFDLVAWFPEADCYGLYNSPYHPANRVEDGYVLKPSTCEHGRFFRAKFGGWGPVTHDIPVTRPSVLQHCGKFGLNGTKDDYDREFNLAVA